MMREDRNDDEGNGESCVWVDEWLCGWVVGWEGRRVGDERVRGWQMEREEVESGYDAI